MSDKSDRMQSHDKHWLLFQSKYIHQYSEVFHVATIGKEPNEFGDPIPVQQLLGRLDLSHVSVFDPRWCLHVARRQL
ncbi:hypothetical protein GCK72_000899 [Caenorhabditis remanei]|uniref:Uncharacterized protein n=1 Tax=Caenorhabditis remanei TaxID=31234 RepID=A0A6A5HQX5_CAERE|nr:hypothetical protein GCK72_000899 [Caenorhabditis remanei]KAF1769086.1 hypothetical protein GCK72_000899 [Caenorhabditis remanei]